MTRTHITILLCFWGAKHTVDPFLWVKIFLGECSQILQWIFSTVSTKEININWKILYYKGYWSNYTNRQFSLVVTSNILYSVATKIFITKIFNLMIISAAKLDSLNFKVSSIQHMPTNQFATQINETILNLSVLSLPSFNYYKDECDKFKNYTSLARVTAHNFTQTKLWILMSSPRVRYPDVSLTLSSQGAGFSHLLASSRKT